MGMRKRARGDGTGTEEWEDSQVTKRGRKFSEQDKRLAKIYEDLASEVGDVRIEAAKELLGEVSPERAEDDAIVEKVITRLFKGLCSSRKAARLGFFMALTEVLRQSFLQSGSARSPLPLQGVLDLVIKTTEPDGSATIQEKRDHLVGRVTACNALLLSHILHKPVLATAELTKVLDILCSLARSKTWLREECGSVIHSYAQGLSESGAAEDIGKLILEAIRRHSLLKTPQGIAIWLAVQIRIGSAALPKNVWKDDDPLHSKNWRSIAVILRTGSVDDTGDEQPDTTRQKGGASQRNPSFAWIAVLTAFVSADSLSQNGLAHASVKSLESFWKEIVDNNLFTQSASQEKKGWGFMVLASAIATLPAWSIQALFSTNLMKTLVNQRADANRYLHSAALLPLNAIKRRASQTPSDAATLLRSLLTTQDVSNFDQATHSKTMENIVSIPYSADVLSDLAAVIRTLIKAVSDRDSKDDPRRTKNRTTVLLDLLVLLVRHHNDYTDGQGGLLEWIKTVLLELVDVAYIQEATAGETEAKMPSDVARLARTRLQTCLSIIISSGVSDGTRCCELVVATMYFRLFNKHGKETLNLDKAAYKRLKSSYEMLKRTKSWNDVPEAVRLLHYLTLLEVHAGDPDALSMLDDIDPLYESTSQESSTDDLDHSMTVVEILLSLLAKPTALFRKLAEIVFTAIAPRLTVDAIQALLDVLEKPESLAGQQQLFDKQEESQDVSENNDVETDEDQDSNGDDSDGDGQSLDSDVEVVDIDEDGESISEIEDSSKINGTSADQESPSDDDSGNESADGTDEEELRKLDAVLAETLGTGNNLEASDEEDSDADMDDDQMMALEPALTKIFQERRKAENSNKKQERKDAKETMINFKNRVLDLIQIYVKKEHDNPLALMIITPLLDLMRLTNTKQLGEKAFNVLKTYFDAGKGKTLPVVANLENVFDIMSQIHQAATRDASKIYSASCSRSSLFLAKILLANTGFFDRIQDLYGDTMKQHKMKGKKSKIQRSFFLDWINYAYDLGR